ncbi:MAG: peptide ABC transporter ATP-binding protein [Microbacterium sp.]|nr:MAG: peptide ABC transporter ATP-binding protein [Microbacterium sp.]
MTALVEVEGLSVDYRRGRERFRAVEGVSLRVERGKTLGLVGESGSGKSTIGSVILGLAPAAEGEVRFDGRTVRRRSRAESVELARRIQAVFQDPYGSMNPTRKVAWTLAEGLERTLRLSRAEAGARIRETLHDVGLGTDVLDRYPAQFSGGQLQRLAIARALVMEPDFIVCDEAVSSLDLSVQAQVINLLERLAHARGLAYLFISHDLPIVAHISDDIAVLFAGQVVEQGPAQLIADDPAHPYTRNLVLSAPVPDPRVQAERRRERRGAAPDSARAAGDPRMLEGCPYALRCPFAIAVCHTSRPALEPRADGRAVACHRYDELTAGAAGTGGAIGTTAEEGAGHGR